MTKKEMSEIFGGMILAWPNAEMFRGGLQKLKPTVELWAACLPEIDYQTGQMVLRELCRKCKFPPTIAEFREEAEALSERIENATITAWLTFKNEMQMTSLKQAYDELPPDSLTRRAINSIGGPERMIIRGDFGLELYNYDGFIKAFRRLLQQPETEAQLRARVTVTQSLPPKGGAFRGPSEGPQAPASRKAGQG